MAAVAYAHAHDVVHRGISPAAVLVSGALRVPCVRAVWPPAHLFSPVSGNGLHVRLASWTSAVSLASPRPLARAVSAGRLWPLTRTVANVCCAQAERCSRYRSPELVINDQDTIANWKAVDVWAVGAVLWEVLNGAHCSPIVSEGSQDRAVLMRALLSWDEFRAPASRAQPMVRHMCGGGDADADARRAGSACAGGAGRAARRQAIAGATAGDQHGVRAHVRW